MLFCETPLPGAWIVDVEPIPDERGMFARTFSAKEFAERGLCVTWVQCSLSHNRKRGTLRGMHFQASPGEETKLIRCTKGAIYDVIIDLRPGSPTFKRWTSVELTEENRRLFYVPVGFAHGFQTLTDNAEVFYQISQFYDPALSRGVRWNDPAFGITWPPAADRIISARDQSHADFAR